MREFYRNLGKLRWLVWVVLGVMVIGVGVAVGTLGAKTEAPAEAKVDELATAPTNADTICELLRSTMEGRYDFCEVYYDKKLDTIVINTANEGMQAGARAVKQGYLQSEWREVRTSMENFSRTVCELCEIQGFEGRVSVSLLNDEDLDKVILWLLDGEIMYDFTK